MHNFLSSYVNHCWNGGIPREDTQIKLNIFLKPIFFNFCNLHHVNCIWLPTLHADFYNIHFFYIRGHKWIITEGMAELLSVFQKSTRLPHAKYAYFSKNALFRVVAMATSYHGNHVLVLLWESWRSILISHMISMRFLQVLNIL